MRTITSTGAQKGQEFVPLKLFYLGSPCIILIGVIAPAKLTILT